jgi:hypothetical protein
MSRIISLGALIILMFIGNALHGQPLFAQTYSLPNRNTDSAANCRVVPRKAGADLWNSGLLSNYTSVASSDPWAGIAFTIASAEGC